MIHQAERTLLCAVYPPGTDTVTPVVERGLVPDGDRSFMPRERLVHTIGASTVQAG